jgi:NTE family protein
MSLKGIFTPVFFQDRFLVDGGLVSPVPVKAAKALGADVVIAVNLAAEMSSRSYISTVKNTAEQFQAIEKAKADDKRLFEHLLATTPLDVKGLPEFLKKPLEKGKTFVGEQAQAFEQWIDVTVEKGKAVLDEKRSLFSEWLTKEENAADLPDIFSVLFNSINIMQFEIARTALKQTPPDVLLSPNLGKVRLLDFDEIPGCIQEGERIAREALPQIREKLGWG